MSIFEYIKNYYYKHIVINKKYHHYALDFPHYREDRSIKDVETNYVNSSGYPVIFSSEHKEYEKYWMEHSKEDRPDWPIPSFDQDDWSKAFIDKTKSLVVYRGSNLDYYLMLNSWFYYALRRGFDEGRLFAIEEMDKENTEKYLADKQKEQEVEIAKFKQEPVTKKYNSTMTNLKYFIIGCIFIIAVIYFATSFSNVTHNVSSIINK